MRKSIKTIAPVALAAVAGAASAQSSVTVYGILDAGIATINHSSNFNGNFVTSVPPYGQSSDLGASQRATGMMNGGESATRIGFSGNEDLGGGNSAFFTLETGFNLGSGSLANSALAGTVRNGDSGAADTSLEGQLFGRQALVGLGNSSAGKIAFGRQYNLMLALIPSYDPVNAQEFSPINFSGSYGGSGVTDDGRIDNAITYAGKFGGVNVGLLYSLGGVAGASSARSNTEVDLGYETDLFGVQALYDSAHDATKLDNNGAAGVPYANGAVGVTFVNLSTSMLLAKFNPLDWLNFKAGFEHEGIKNPSNPTSDAATTTIYSFPVGHVNVSPFGTGPSQTVNVYWVGAGFLPNAANKISIGFYHGKQNDYSNGSTTAANSGKLAGNDTYYSLMYEYFMSKRTNFYAATLFNKKTGGFENGVNGTTIGASTGVDSWNTIGVGIRHKF